MAPENSENKHLMTGLHLMFLLAANRLSDFHMLLEQIPQKEQTSNAYISTPVRIEQSLMEGAYNKVVLTEKNIPSPFYTIFIRIMLDTIRREIATSIEKSFKVLTAKDATVMLLFDNDEQMKKFGQEVIMIFKATSIKKYIYLQRKWHLDGERYVFEIEVAQEKPVNLDTVRVATQTLFYAKQLEQIV